MGKTNIFSSFFWASIQRFGTMIISFFTNMVLARLLTPADFGTVGMLLLFINIANTFIDSGLGSALIQKKDVSLVDYSTVFFTNLLLSIVVYFVLYFIAPNIASFYDLPILCIILRIEGLVLLLNSFCIIQTTILRKTLDFRKLSIANIVGNIVGSVIGITLALYDYGVWSLVVRMLSVSLFVTLSLWYLNSWRPSFRFSINSFRNLFGFGSFMLLSSIMTTFSNNIQTVIMGKMFKPVILGTYTQAQQLKDIPTMSISSIISQVLYPVFSSEQNNIHSIQRKLLLSIDIISYLTSAIIFLLILIAKSLIIILYSEKWISSVEMFQILCIGGLFISLQDVNFFLIAAKGKSRLLFFLNFYSVVIGLVLKIIGAICGGIQGLLFSIVLTSFVFYCIYAFYAARYSQTSIFSQFKLIIFNISLSIVSYILSCLMLNFLNLSHFGTLLIIPIFFCAIHLLISYLIKVSSFVYVLNFIKKKIKYDI